MHDHELTRSQLQWAIEQQQLIVEAADAKLRWAERILTQASTERAVIEAHNRADMAIVDVEMAEDRLRQLQRQVAAVTATAPGQPAAAAASCLDRHRCLTLAKGGPSRYFRTSPEKYGLGGILLPTNTRRTQLVQACSEARDNGSQSTWQNSSRR